jgi:hypothetical protein
VIIDERTYTLVANKVPEFLAFYQREGYPIQIRHLGEPIGFFTTDTGTLNQIVHLWGYQDYADRQTRRAGMVADPEWQAYLQNASPYFLKMENRILMPTTFSAIR